MEVIETVVTKQLEAVAKKIRQQAKRMKIPTDLVTMIRSKLEANQAMSWDAAVRQMVITSDL
jgi:hypothetical protein